MKFSVLLPIYLGTKACELDACFTSLFDQTRQPDEIVLILDGPVNKTVHNCISQHITKLPIRQLNFPSNRGLGPALQDGLNVCTHDLVARVDSDDKSNERRFELQLSFFQKKPTTSVLGGVMREWYRTQGKRHPIDRNVPLTPYKISIEAKSRNPFNHPTVMFRKSDVLRCGGYENYPGFEDYFLWIKMIRHGLLMYNVPDVLVETDIDRNYFSRRGGLKYISNELRLAKNLRQVGYFSNFDFFKFLLYRFPFRLIPNNFRRSLYRIFLRNPIRKI